MDKEEFKRKFAIRLFNIIEEKNISRADLAHKAEIGYASLASYLAAQKVGKGALPPLDVTVRLADALGVTIDYLLNGREEPVAPLEHTITTPPQGDAQQLLRDLYQSVTALNFNVEVQGNGDVALISSNQFVRMFFEQIQRGDDLQTVLNKFSDLKVSKGTLIDPVTYRLLHGEEDEK